VPGLQPQTALQHAGGREDLLLAVLRRFVGKYGPQLPPLNDTATAQAQADCAQAVHSLRGACATIGFTALAQDLLAYETALKGPHDPALGRRMGTAVQEELMSSLVRLHQALAAPASN